MIPSPLIFTAFFLVLLLLKIFAIERYAKRNHDYYNHLAALRSFSNNLVYQSSAINEKNYYPPGVYFFILSRVRNQVLIRYFSVFVECLMLISILIFYWNKSDLQVAFTLASICLLSSSMFFESTFFSARVLGIFFYNLLLITVCSELSIHLKILVESLLFVAIFFFSHFTTQVVLMAIFPAAILTGKIDILVSLSTGLLFGGLLSNGYMWKILKSNTMHNVWCFSNLIEFYCFRGYFREVMRQRVVKNEFDFKQALKKLVTLPVREPTSIVMLFVCLVAPVEYIFFSVVVLILTAISILLPFSRRLERTIGDSRRYFEYAVFSVSIVAFYQRFFINALFINMMVLCFVCMLSFIVYKLKMQFNEVSENAVCNDNSDLQKLVDTLNAIKKTNILTLPISISNYLALKTHHKYFYAYGYEGEKYLSDYGIMPYFRFDDDNLINMDICEMVIFGASYVDNHAESSIRDRYNLKLLTTCGEYTLYTK